MLEGLIEVKNRLNLLGIPLICLKINDKLAIEIATELSKSACEIIIDAGYLRNERLFEKKLNDNLIDCSRRFTCIEGNLIVPVTVIFHIFSFDFLNNHFFTFT